MEYIGTFLVPLIAIGWMALVMSGVKRADQR